MELIAPAAVGLLVCSLAANGVLAWLLRRALAKPPKPDPVPSLTAEQLIHDLTSGAAVVRIERINPSDIFLRSPRT